MSVLDQYHTKKNLDPFKCRVSCIIPVGATLKCARLGVTEFARAEPLEELSNEFPNLSTQGGQSKQVALLGRTWHKVLVVTLIQDHLLPV